MKAPSLFSIISMIWKILDQHDRRRWAMIAGLAIITSTLEVITAVTIVGVVQALNAPEQATLLFQKLSLFPGYAPHQYMTILLLSFGAIFLLKNCFAAFEIFCQSLTIQSINQNMKMRMLKRYSEASYSFYQTRTSSHLLNVIGGDVDMTCASGLVALATITSESCVLIFLAAMITYINPQATLTIAGICLFVGGLFFFFLLPRFYKWGQINQQAAQETYQTLIEFFQGFKEILLYGRRGEFLNRFAIIFRRKAIATARNQAANSIPRIGIEIVFVMIFIVTVLTLISSGMPLHQIAGLMGAYLYAGFRMMPGLNRIIIQSSILKLVAPNIERILFEIQNMPTAAKIQDESDFRFDKDLTFDHVIFSYGSSDRAALKDISFTIKKGEIIGIAGETGSGKSTLIDMILGLHPPDSGIIMVDGKYSVNCRQWHSMIGYVPQSIYLFEGTLRENILFGADASEINEEQLRKIVAQSQLEKMIAALPSGIDTQIGERGIRLSGGERQRVAVARALVRNASVLVFDEATSALDNETEDRLVEMIDNVVKDRTVITIAHRITTLKNCDRIYVLNNGRIDRITDYQGLLADTAAKHLKLL